MTGREVQEVGAETVRKTVRKKGRERESQGETHIEKERGDNEWSEDERQ